MPNKIPLYVHNKFNYSPSILRNIPLSTNKRLTKISSYEQSFKQATPLYQKALNKCGHKHELTFKHPSNQTNNNNSKRRKKNISEAQIRQPLATSSTTLIYLLANQMCPTYPTNQSDCLKIGIRLRYW